MKTARTPYEYDLKDLQRMAPAANYRHWLYRALEPHLGKMVLEIGAGIGDLTECIAGGREVFATDISNGCLELLAKRFSEWKNVTVARFDIMDADIEAWRSRHIDTAVSMQLFEHIQNDIRAFENILKILEEGGKIIAMVPALKPLYGTIDRALGHRRRYSRKEITDKIARAGFVVTDCFYLNMVGAIGWFINARILRRTAQSAAQIKVFDKVVVPIMSRLEGLLGAIPFGQTLYCIGEKPAGR